jgi:hypothetical protein
MASGARTEGGRNRWASNVEGVGIPVNASHFAYEPSEEENRERCSAGCGNAAQCVYNDEPVCYECLDDYATEITGEPIAEFCRRRFIEREAT